jgi:hypothetical protein
MSRPGRLVSSTDEFEAFALFADRGEKTGRDSALTRRLESPATASMETPKLDAMDFESEKRPRKGYIALSWSYRT